MRLLVSSFVALVLLALACVATHALWWQMREHPRSYAEADWSSAGLLPAAARETDAVVHVMAGRTGRWKGIFAHHMWIVVKPARAQAYTRYEVVGWGAPVRVNGQAADGRWYGDAPVIYATLRGSAAEAAIPRIEASVRSYVYSARGSYVVWPGPNSNTFVATIARAVPELAAALLPTAIGKDFAGWPFFAGWAPSRTGLQVSLGGLVGASLGWVEGLEVNLFGLVVGIDVRRPALKLPGWGRIGLPAV